MAARPAARCQFRRHLRDAGMTRQPIDFLDEEISSHIWSKAGCVWKCDVDRVVARDEFGDHHDIEYSAMVRVLATADPNELI